MMILKKHLPRRTVLRGMGAALAVPLLDAMVPAYTAAGRTAATPVKRIGAVYFPHGCGDMTHYTPPTEGLLEMPPVLAPLSGFRDRLLVASGLDCQRMYVQDGGPHPRAQTTWLTGCTARRTEGPDIRAGVSMDQVAARVFARQTQLASLELGIEPVEMIGACALGYSCAYSNTISWRTPTTPLPMENNPRAVFERLFGASDSTDREARAADIMRDRSILDSVIDEVRRLQGTLGARDRNKVNDYLESLRDVERRIGIAEQQLDQELPVVERPIGVPAVYEEHVKLMFDLLALAFQTDLTRVSTFLMARENSNRPYLELGVADGHHGLSHHQDNPEKIAQLFKINTFHAGLLAHLLERLRATEDGDGSLLDHTLLLYGSGMSNPNLHDWSDVPTVVVAGSIMNIKTGRHVRLPKGTPLASMQLTLLDRVGVQIEEFGDSAGRLEI